MRRINIMQAILRAALFAAAPILLAAGARAQWAELPGCSGTRCWGPQTPMLQGEGYVLGGPVRVHLLYAPPQATAIFFLADRAQPFPFREGTFCPAPVLGVAMATGGAFALPGSGGATLPLQVPKQPELSGRRLLCQAVVLDYQHEPAICLTGGLSLILRESAGMAIAEYFLTDAQLDRERSGAAWGGGELKPGVLGGSGLLGDLEVASGRVVLNTDNQIIDGAGTLTGLPITVTDGVFSFGKIHVAPGAELRITGAKGARLMARGEIRIEGRVDAGGEAGPATNGSASATTGGRGGQGGPGGANGGAGGSWAVPGPIDGQPGGDLKVPAGHPAAAQAAGTGGKGSSANPAGAVPGKVTYNAFYGYYSQQVSAGGSGGGFLGAGSKGSCEIPETNYPGDLGVAGAGGAAFPVLPLAGQLATSRQFPIGGAGGGGAGLHAADSPSFGAKEWHPSAGGGGGGGGIVLQAGGGFHIYLAGIIAATGGAGGAAVPGTAAAPGGGGSGGSVLIQAGGPFSCPGSVDAGGGAGGATTSSHLPPPWRSTGGAGAPGYIRVEHDPIVLFTTLTGFTPPATGDNTALLQEADPVTGAASLWYDTRHVLPMYLHYRVKAWVGSREIVYTDDQTTPSTPARLGVTPVAIFLQGARLDAARQPIPGTVTRWVAEAAHLGDPVRNGGVPVPRTFRWTVIFDRSLAPGQDLKVTRVEVAVL